MGRRLAKDRLKNGVSSFAGSFDVSGPLACFSTQVIGLSQLDGSYFLENFELIALSGLPRKKAPLWKRKYRKVQKTKNAKFSRMS